MTPLQQADANKALSGGPIADVGGLLKPGGRRELEQAIAGLARRGLSAHVALVPEGEALGPWHVLWNSQGFDAKSDLLLLFNGKRWEARGWNLGTRAIESALEAAEPALKQYYGRGLTAALANLAAATGAAPADKAPVPAGRSSSASSSVLGPVLGVAAVAGVAAVGWVIVRRSRRAGESQRSLAEARSAADQVFSEVVLATETLDGPEAAELRDKATRMREQLDAIAPPGLKQLPAKEESLTLAQLRQMENELEALRSSVLQLKRTRVEEKTR